MIVWPPLTAYEPGDMGSRSMVGTHSARMTCVLQGAVGYTDAMRPERPNGKPPEAYAHLRLVTDGEDGAS